MSSDGTFARIDASSSSATSWASASVIPPGSFTWSESSLRPSTSTRLTLWISRTAGTAAAAAWTRSRGVGLGAGLDVDDDVAAGERLLQRVLDRIGRRVALADPGRGRDADHDIRELPAAGLPHPQPPQLDDRPELGDRRARRCLGARRRAVHQHVDVHADQPGSAREHEHGDEERGGRVAVGIPGPNEQEADEDGDRAGEVARKMHGIGGQRRASRPARHPPREHGPGGVDRDHDEDRDEDVRRGDGLEGCEPTSCWIARNPMNTLASERNEASASAARCSALPCPYWCERSAGRPETPSAKKVRSAATRSVPECTASDTSPRLCAVSPT